MARSNVLTGYLTEDTAEEARNASYRLRISLSQLIESALSAYLTRLQRKHNSGRRFPRRRAESPRGRRPAN